jgi:hypothetical protein
MDLGSRRVEYPFCKRGIVRITGDMGINLRYRTWPELWKNKKIKIKSYKLQAPSRKRATICRIDTRCRGASIWQLTMELGSNIIVDMKNKKGEKYGRQS